MSGSAVSIPKASPIIIDVNVLAMDLLAYDFGDTGAPLRVTLQLTNFGRSDANKFVAGVRS